MAVMPLQNWRLMEDPATLHYPASPPPRETWLLPNGTAWVYLAPRHRVLTKPVILADGFSLGASNRDELYFRLERCEYPFISGLHEHGFDLVVVGYHERSAKIQDNAEAAAAAIMQAIGERRGTHSLLAGGFSMGALVMRYALAKMEFEGMNHQTSTYISFDGPHRGAWIPISLQAMAHVTEPFAPDLRRQINSPAARQLLWRHIDTLFTAPREDPLRSEFLAELRAYGGWPVRPTKFGLANGAGDGIGNEVPAGRLVLHGDTADFGIELYAQDSGPGFVTAAMRYQDLIFEQKTDSLPRLDGAPGGMLECFGIAVENLKQIDPYAECRYPSAAFVPSVSAVAIRDLDSDEAIYADINSLSPEESEFDDYLLSGTNTPHSAMTKEIATWFYNHLPRR